MRTMVEKGLLLMFSLALMLTSSFVAGSGSSYAYASGPYVELIAGMLIAISATGLAEWRARHAWAWLPACGYAIAAMVLPLWIMFLPVIAYDAAKTTMPLPSLIHVLSRTSTPKQPSSPTAVSSVAS